MSKRIEEFPTLMQWAFLCLLSEIHRMKIPKSIIMERHLFHLIPNRCLHACCRKGYVKVDHNTKEVVLTATGMRASLWPPKDADKKPYDARLGIFQYYEDEENE